jgi:hypothetical protein
MPNLIKYTHVQGNQQNLQLIIYMVHVQKLIHYFGLINVTS